MKSADGIFALKAVSLFQNKYGKRMLTFAYHAALPVVITPELLHLIRINFFFESDAVLPYTAEVDLLFSDLCQEVDKKFGLYEFNSSIRELLLRGLQKEFGLDRIREVSALLYQYSERSAPWVDRVELERAQQLTALNFLNPEKAEQWLRRAEQRKQAPGSVDELWFAAVRKKLVDISRLLPEDSINKFDIEQIRNKLERMKSAIDKHEYEGQLLDLIFEELKVDLAVLYTLHDGILFMPPSIRGDVFFPEQEGLYKGRENWGMNAIVNNKKYDEYYVSDVLYSKYGLNESFLEREKIKSSAYIKFTENKTIIALLALYSRTPRDWGDEEQWILSYIRTACTPEISRLLGEEKPPLRVFVSLPINELPAESRTINKIIDNQEGAVRRAEIRSSDEVASSQEIVSGSLSEADIFIGVFGNHYSVRMIEEYEQAKNLDIPLQIYEKRANAANRDPKLQEFIDKIGRDGQVIGSFTTADELRKLVKGALAWRIGKRRATKLNPREVIRYLPDNEKLTAAANWITANLKCAHCTVFIPDRSEKEVGLIPAATSGPPGYLETIKKQRIKIDQGVTGWVLQKGKPAIFADEESDLHVPSSWRKISGRRSELAVPIKFKDRTIGVISADQDIVDWFTKDDLRLVEKIAQEIGPVLMRSEENEIINRIRNNARLNKTLNDVVEDILVAAVYTTNTDFGGIDLLSEDGLSIAKRFSYPKKFQRPMPRLEIGVGITRQVVDTGKGVIVSDVHSDSRVNPLLSSVGIRSFISVPVIYRQKVIGVLSLHSRASHEFDEYETRILIKLSTLAGEVVHQDDVRSKKQRISRRALIADNDPDYRALLKELLESEGYQVIEASTLEGAVKKIGNADIAIIDIRLQDDNDENDSSGLDLAKAAILKKIPCIIMTSFLNPELARSAYQRIDVDTDFCDFYNKSAEPGILLEKIRMIAARSYADAIDQQKMHFRKQSIAPLLYKSIELFDSVAANRNIKFKISIEGAEEHPIEISREQMQIALNNLVDNAVKYSFNGDPNKPRFVDIKAFPEENAYIIKITDYGVGIMNDELPHIFERYFRARAAHDRNRTGAGIGLAIVRRIIESHQGSIEIESKPQTSKAELEGSPYLTTFTIRLPYKHTRKQ